MLAGKQRDTSQPCYTALDICTPTYTSSSSSYYTSTTKGFGGEVWLFFGVFCRCPSFEVSGTLLSRDLTLPICTDASAAAATVGSWQNICFAPTAHDSSLESVAIGIDDLHCRAHDMTIGP